MSAREKQNCFTSIDVEGSRQNMSLSLIECSFDDNSFPETEKDIKGIIIGDTESDKVFLSKHTVIIVKYLGAKLIFLSIRLSYV